jgi:hypothetical protein
MLTDPLSMTGNGAAVNLARVSVNGSRAVYEDLSRTAGNEFKVTISHEDVGTGIGRRKRSLMRSDENIILSDTVTPGTNIIQLTIDRPVNVANDTVLLEALAKMVNHLDDATKAQAHVDGQS